MFDVVVCVVCSFVLELVLFAFVAIVVFVGVLRWCVLFDCVVVCCLRFFGACSCLRCCCLFVCWFVCFFVLFCVCVVIACVFDCFDGVLCCVVCYCVVVFVVVFLCFNSCVRWRCVVKMCFVGGVLVCVVCVVCVVVFVCCDGLVFVLSV